MARSGTEYAPKKVLTADQIEKCIGRLDQRIEELEAFDVSSTADGTSPQLRALSAAVRDTLDRCFGERSSAFHRFESAIELSWSAGVYYDGYPQQHHYLEGTKGKISSAIAMLKEAQRTLREDLADAAHSQYPVSQIDPAISNRVFVVHGHDDAAKEGLARFLEKIGLEAIILDEQPNQGRTIIEKFETYAGEVGFAVILMTPDDLGGAKAASAPNARMRQNVLFELGYFSARLGRGKVCLLRSGDVEIPSDLYGVVYIELDTGDSWKLKLVRELKAAGLACDANRIWA